MTGVPTKHATETTRELSIQRQGCVNIYKCLEGQKDAQQNRLAGGNVAAAKTAYLR